MKARLAAVYSNVRSLAERLRACGEHVERSAKAKVGALFARFVTWYEVLVWTCGVVKARCAAVWSDVRSLAKALLAYRKRVGRSANAEVSALLAGNPVACRNRYPLLHRFLHALFHRGTFARFIAWYVVLDLVVVMVEALRPHFPPTDFALPSFEEDVILYLSSYVLGAQIGLLGVISLALALVTLVAQNEEAAIDVKVYYHESMFLGIAASGVALSAVVSIQFLWPLQSLLHAAGGGTTSLFYRSVLVSAEVVWLVLNLAAVAHFISTTFGFVQRDARERLRERYTANVVVPRDLLQRVRSNLYAAAGGATRSDGAKAFLGFGFGFDSGLARQVELEDDFRARSAVVDLRSGLLTWVVARWSKRCGAAPAGTTMTSVGPTLWFAPLLDQPLEGRIVWCRRSGGVPLTAFERWILRRAFVIRRSRID
ncbi:hypothetical protein [Novosphingobium clariflavum]|uniref:Uncharacterized protein n=1 Tax=Novosphingobium clariflavum TaxID=2029884 RepID=A0ABV6S3V3_9SPHN|nr:hypothetical protein [Novosphingobium clariflavum]